MAKRMKKQVAAFAVVVFLLTLFPAAVFAEETHDNQVHVVVENVTYGTVAGAPWEGKKVDTWVTLTPDSTGITVLQEAVGGAEQLDVVESTYGAYINGILGITNGDGGTTEGTGYNMAGWMFAVNGTMASSGIGDYSVVAGTLSAGDELSFHYSVDGGADIGYDWADTSQKALKALTTSTGVLSPSFSSGVTAYTLTIPVGTQSVVFTPVAENMNETVTIKVGDTVYKRAMGIPVAEGTQILIQCSNGTEQTEYSIYVKQEVSGAASEMYDDTMKLIQGSLTTETCVYGNEWAVMSAARAGKLTQEQAETYYASVEEVVKQIGDSTLDTYATTNAKVILVLTAIGKNPAQVAGNNLLEPLADLDYVKKQGVNAAMYALLAFDSGAYEIPTVAEGKTQTTREALIQIILDGELSGGGWDWMGSSADPDLTANALQALTPYYESNASVKAAIVRGLQALSDIQNPDGSYSSWGTPNACSTAQVLTALTGLGIDPSKDSRFIKNGFTALQGLGYFYLPGSGFRYDFSGMYVDFPYSTIQASYALVSCQRLLNGQKRLYDMTDVSVTDEETTTTESSNTTTEGNVANTNTPATGDEAMLLLLAALAVLSGAGLGVTLRKSK